MTSNVTYWVASHLTGIFEIVDQAADFLQRGSRGAGISINRGVSTTISESDSSDVSIFFNKKSITAEAAAITSKIIDLILPENARNHFSVNHDFEVPLSAGYGASAAGALSCAFALKDFFDLDYSDLKIFQIAHQAEVLLKSGLGDILGLHQGGLEIRIKPGAPGIGETTYFTNEEEWKVATLSFGEISTASVLTDQEKRGTVSCAGFHSMKDLVTNNTFMEFIRQAKIFTESVGLMSAELKSFTSSLPKEIESSQIMLGDSLFLFYKDQDVLDELKKKEDKIIQEDICQETVKRRK